MRIFTSANLAYLDRVAVLNESLKKYNPEVIFTLVLVDDFPSNQHQLSLISQFDQVLPSESLGIPNYQSWSRELSVVELCTAVKPFALQFLLSYGDDVVYLDPDIAVFNSFDVLKNLLVINDLVLTPHILEGELDVQSIEDNELACLRFGTYNLGFIGVKNSAEGRKFADWWAQRLYTYCLVDHNKGLFVDQKWIDLVPSLFNAFIWKNPGANFASWNLNHRKISYRNGDLIVNEDKLIFIHFSKARSDGLTMTARYGDESLPLAHLWRWYLSRLDSYDNKY